MKKLLLTGTALSCLFAASPALAVNNEELLAQMKAMQAQMAQMQKEMNVMRSELEKAKAQVKSNDKVIQAIKDEKISTKPESDVKISMVPAPKFETADGNYSFKVGGFAQVDVGAFNDDRRDHPDGTNVRRARLNASGTLAKDWKYKIENDFAGNASALTDVYLEYAGFEPVSIMVGQFKEPFGLETLTSDLFTTFNERASLTVFSPDRKIGGAVSTYGMAEPLGAWTASVGAFGGATSTTSSTNDEAQDFTGRLTWAPIAEKTRLLHFGVAGSYRIPDTANDTMSFSARGENQMSTAAADGAVATGNITNINNVNMLGLEAAAVYGPASLQGEYMQAYIHRRGSSVDEKFDGYYIEGSYFLTGESRNYSTKTAKFDRVRPNWSLSLKEGHWGAWQVAARYSVLDLNGKVVRGGEMKNWTLGLRWIPHAHVSITANFIKQNTDSFSVTPNDDPNIWLLRTQFDF